MQLVDAGMLAFPAFHALKGRVDRPLTYQVPRMLRSRIRDAGDTYALFWNAERLRKREAWPRYRDRPEIWEEAGREDFESMLELLSALGAVQFRADGIPRVVPPSTARELIETRGHVRDWIDRDLRVDPETERAIAENREQLRLNLRLTDLSEEAVGDPPSPRWDGWAEPEIARRIGEEHGIGYLTEEDPSAEFGVLLDWGKKTRERLSELDLD